MIRPFEKVMKNRYAGLREGPIYIFISPLNVAIAVFTLTIGATVRGILDKVISLTDFFAVY